MDLRSPGSPPFHLVARVHYNLAGSATDGTYEMLWLAPDRWREDIKMDGVGSETEIAQGDKIVSLRSSSGPILPLASIRGVLLPERKKAYTWDLKMKKIHLMPVDGEQRVCIDSKQGPALKETACLDRTAAEVSVLRDLEFLESMERSDFVFVGDKRYPRHIATHFFDETMDIHVELLAVPQEGIESALAAPEGAVVRDWCPKEEIKESVGGPASPVFMMRPPGAVIRYYVLVDTNGRVKEWAPLRKETKTIDALLATPDYLRSVQSSGSGAPILLQGKYLGSMDKTMAAWFPEARLAKRSCGGKPIEYEYVMQAPVAIPRSN